MMVTLTVDTIDWSVTGVFCHLLLGSHLSYCDMLVDTSVDLIYSILRTGNS